MDSQKEMSKSELIVAIFNECQEIIGILLSFGLVAFVVHSFHDDITAQAGVIVAAALNLPSLIIGRMWGKASNGNDDTMKKVMASMAAPKPPPDPPPPAPDDGPPVVPVKNKAKAVVSPVVPGVNDYSGDRNKLVGVAKGFVDKVDETTVHGGKRIAEWAKHLGFDIAPDGQTPWCSIFIGAMLLLAGFQPLRTMRARDYATYGDDVNDGQPGDLWVGNSHVAVIIGKKSDGDYLICGGNQTNNVLIHPASAYGQPIAIRRPV